MKPIPSLTDIYSNISSDLKSRLDLVQNSDLKLTADALASTLAGQLKLCYLLLIDIQNNLFPDTADTAENGGELNRIGRIYLNRNPRTSTDGTYTASVSGVSGSQIRAGLTFKSNDNSNAPGNLYITDQEYILTGTDDVIVIRSLDPGKEFELKPGDGLTITEPVIGVDNLILIETVVQQPTEGEDTELYRQNTTDAIQLEPQGGSRTDYRIWAADAAGVRKVYPFVKVNDAGTVQVFVEATKVDSLDSFGTPSTAILNEVKDVLLFDPDETLPTGERGRIPIQATPEVLPIAIKPVDVVISGLQVDSTSIRASITANLEAFLYALRPYISGADLPRDKNDVLTAVKLQSVVNDTISNTNSFISFQMSVDGVPVNLYSFTGGNIPYLRTVTYS